MDDNEKDDKKNDGSDETMELWTIEQAAKAINKSEDSLYRATRNGNLAYVERYGRRLVRPEDARAYNPQHGGKRAGAGGPGKKRTKPSSTFVRFVEGENENN